MLFGGDVGQGPIDDIFFLSLVEKQWTRSSAEGSPTPRAFHTATLVGDSIYVCGGTTSHGLDNALYAYKVPTKQWTKVSCSGAAPAPRYGHAAVAVGPLLIVAGGATAAGPQKDVFAFDTRALRTSRAAAASAKAERERVDECPQAPAFGRPLPRGSCPGLAVTTRSLYIETPSTASR